MRYLTFFLTLFSFLSIHYIARAQAPNYDDLRFMYVDEEYEKCLWKAEKYTVKDDTRRDPLPYLYMSMCLYDMSKMDKYAFEPDYKYAARDALKYAKRFRKKDKELAWFHNYEDYWADLNTQAMETGMMYLDEGDHSRAKRQFDSMASYYPENPGAWQMLALCQAKLNLVRDAAISMKEFQKAYAAVPDIERLPKDQRQLLRTSLIRYSDFLAEKGMLDSARATIALGEDHFAKNPEFKAALDDLN